MKEVSVFDAKTQFSGLIEQVHQRHESIIITRRGMRIAIIVPFEEQQRENVPSLLRGLNVLGEEIGKVGVGLMEIKNMKEESRR